MPVPAEPQSGELGWTLPQRRALLFLTSLLLLFLVIQLALRRQFVPTDLTKGSRAAELASRLDPNTADWQALAAVPNLGEKRAKDIVSHRERMRNSDPSTVVFKTVYDLRLVRGIGPAMVEKLRPYLIFPGENPASLPTAPQDPDPAQ